MTIPHPLTTAVAEITTSNNDNEGGDEHADPHAQHGEEDGDEEERREERDVPANGYKLQVTSYK